MLQSDRIAGYATRCDPALEKVAGIFGLTAAQWFDEHNPRNLARRYFLSAMKLAKTHRNWPGHRADYFNALERAAHFRRDFSKANVS